MPTVHILEMHDLVAEQPVEIVECKGLGHPDTICDALAEEVSLALSAAYVERFGQVLHHNVDKVLLVGGRSRPAFGGGEIIEPIEIIIAGRATSSLRGATVPVDEIAVEACRGWLRAHLHALDVDRHVRIVTRIRPGSEDLTELFIRGQAGSAPRSNDTSCGVGYAPLTPLENAVVAAQAALNGPEARQLHPALGEDVKVMGIREGSDLDVTIACAMIGRHVADLPVYRRSTATAAALVRAAISSVTNSTARIQVNTADDFARDAVYLTVTGLSAESGDDGEAGRGNRVNGLITPMRPMTMESVAGKNAVNHTGKLYNLAAARVAEAIVRELPQVRAAECFLVSRIGAPIDEPALTEIRIASEPTGALRAQIGDLLRNELALLTSYSRALATRSLGVNRWPLGSVASHARGVGPDMSLDAASQGSDS